MRVVLPGGTGQVGRLLQRHFEAKGDEVVVLSRSGAPGCATWDGESLGEWVSHLDGADAVVNLAGRTVNCRYSERNLVAMMDSRVNSARVVGEAIARVRQPPTVWLQMSTATIYAHRFDAANDEATGVIGGDEPDVPAYWARSIDIAKEWERTLDAAQVQGTRKLALRSAIVMAPDEGGAFDIMTGLTNRWLGGAIGGGRQWVSWIHGHDFCRAVDWLLQRDDISGAVNLAAPEPLPQASFQAELRRALGGKPGLPATAWMARLGAFFLRTDAELVLKSRRVVPGRLLESGFRFEYPAWPQAADNLVASWRASRGR